MIICNFHWAIIFKAMASTVAEKTRLMASDPFFQIEIRTLRVMLTPRGDGYLLFKAKTWDSCRPKFTGLNTQSGFFSSRKTPIDMVESFRHYSQRILKPSPQLPAYQGSPVLFLVELWNWRLEKFLTLKVDKRRQNHVRILDLDAMCDWHS